MGYFLRTENIAITLNDWCCMHNFDRTGTSSNKVWYKRYSFNDIDVSLIIHMDSEYIEIDLPRLGRHKDIRFKELRNYEKWREPFILQGFLYDIDIEIELMVI